MYLVANVPSSFDMYLFNFNASLLIVLC
jgi:hypothetical protein